MAPIPETQGCSYTVFEGDAVWSLVGRSSFPVVTRHVAKINPQTKTVEARIPLSDASARSKPSSVDAGEGAVWLGMDGFPASIYKVDPIANRVTATIPLGSKGFSRTAARLSVGEGAVWAVVIPMQDVLYRVDPKSNEVTPIQLSHKVGDVYAGAGAIWVRHTETETISRLDPRSYRLVATIPIPESLAVRLFFEYPNLRGRWMTMGAGDLWVPLGPPTRKEGAAGWNKVGRLDPRSNRFVGTVDPGVSIFSDIDSDGAAIWVAAGDLVDKPSAVHLAGVEIDATTNTAKRKISLGRTGGGAIGFLAVGADAAWVCLPSSGIYRLPAGEGSR